MNLDTTRAIIDAIHNGHLEKIPTYASDVFGLQIPESCPGVDTNILNPKNTWADKNLFD